MSQRRVLLIGAALVAAGIGVPGTAIMAPRWASEPPPAAPAPAAPAAPEPPPAIVDNPPVAPVNDSVPAEPTSSPLPVPPGTIGHFPEAEQPESHSLPPQPAVTPTRTSHHVPDPPQQVPSMYTPEPAPPTVGEEEPLRPPAPLDSVEPDPWDQ